MTDNRSDSLHYRPWLKGLGCLHRKFARYCEGSNPSQEQKRSTF
jgi:hypothetical protein